MKLYKFSYCFKKKLSYEGNFIRELLLDDLYKYLIRDNMSNIGSNNK